MSDETRKFFLVLGDGETLRTISEHTEAHLSSMVTGGRLIRCQTDDGKDWIVNGAQVKKFRPVMMP